MTLVVEIEKSKETSIWKEYKDAEGNVLARFKIRGESYKPYRVALERAQNQVASKGYVVSTASGEDKLYHELLLEAAACHLIEDWDGVSFRENSKVTEQPCTPENATKLLNMGDIGVAIWAFVKHHAEQIQINANKTQAETLGKSSSSTNSQSDTQDSQSIK